MLKNYALIAIGLSMLLLAACGGGDSKQEEEEINVIISELSDERSSETLVELIDAVYENEPYEDKLTEAKTEAENTINQLEGLDLSSKLASKLRDSYASSIEDFKEIINMIEANDGELTEEDWSTIEEISKRAKEKQMELINEKMELMEEELPTN